MIFKKLFVLLALATCTTLKAQDSKYLFAYFPSNDNENIYFALADKDDPFNFIPMNDGQAVVKADTTTVMGGLRDPHLLKCDDGWYRMVATDMRCSLGWSSNRGLVLMRSRDLIHWEHHTVHFPQKYEGSYLANVTRVWAPETIYDPVAKRYLVYFSILTNDGSVPYDKVYYAYANDDFSDLETEPEFFFDRGKSTIDMDIVYNPADKLYHAIYKNENDGGICMVTAQSLTPAEGQAPGSQWSKPSESKQQTRVGVEGAGMYRMIDSDKWVLMYDCYNNGYYQFCTSTDLDHFTLAAQTNTGGMFTPRHGSIITLTQDQTDAISSYWLHKDDAYRQALIDQDNQWKNEYTEEVEFPLNWTNNNITTRSGQHWDGTSSNYYEQNDGWGWSSWEMSMTEDIVLPAGDYLLRAACRASADVTATLSATSKAAQPVNASALFPTKGDNGRGIALDGATTWDDKASYANDNGGRGWEWRYLTITSDGVTPITIAVNGSANIAHQWMSVANFALRRRPAASSGIHTVKASSAPSARKYLNGTSLIITKGSNHYNVAGQRVNL